MKLFLFDIDGTLLTTDGAGRAALKSAGNDLFGFEEDLRTISVSGSTDTAIVQEVLRHHSLEVSTANINRYLGGYLVRLRQHLASLSGAILPGVISLLDVLAQDGQAIGLLTGNVRRGAEIKLTAHGIWDRFGFGAFTAVAYLGREQYGRRTVLSFRQYAAGGCRPDLGCAIPLAGRGGNNH